MHTSLAGHKSRLCLKRYSAEEADFCQRTWYYPKPGCTECQLHHIGFESNREKIGLAEVSIHFIREKARATKAGVCAKYGVWIAYLYQTESLNMIHPRPFMKILWEVRWIC